MIQVRQGKTNLSASLLPKFLLLLFRLKVHRLFGPVGIRLIREKMSKKKTPCVEQFEPTNFKNHHLLDAYELSDVVIGIF